MITAPFLMLFLLIAAHALCDYALQTEWMSEAKNHRHHMGRGVWPMVLASHALIHGGAVALLTGSALLGVAETLAHAAIDYAKCEQKIDFKTDQALHLTCKLTWFLAWLAL